MLLKKKISVIFIPIINKTLVYAIIKETVDEYCVDSI